MNGTSSSSTTTATGTDLIKSNSNKTISELVKEQAEAIKKIVSAQKPINTQIDYPTVTRKDPDTKLKEIKEQESIEELRVKCQHLFKITNRNDDGDPNYSSAITTSTFATVLPFGPPQKPEFLKHKKINNPNHQNIESFEAKPTAPIATTPTPSQQQEIMINNDNMAAESTQTNPVISNYDEDNYYYPYPTNDKAVKYIKLEPVILQRLLMSNGQSYFYWYQTVPNNYVKYAEPHTLSTSSSNQYNTYNNLVQDNTNNNNNNKKYNVQYVVPAPINSNNLDLTASTTTTEKSTTKSYHLTETTGATLMPTTLSNQQQQLINNGYKHEFKFVIPYSFKQVVYPTANYQQQFDPYAYYPKFLQPNTMNVQVPYQPTFHMIKSLSIPNDEQVDEHKS